MVEIIISHKALLGANMTTIHADQNVITQINVFEVDPRDQDALASLLIESARHTCDIQGWISASVHKSLDGKRVTNYAQASGQASMEAILGKLRKDGIFERIQQISKPNSGLYVCVFSLSADRTD
jgi:hypothetical protein